MLKYTRNDGCVYINIDPSLKISDTIEVVPGMVMVDMSGDKVVGVEIIGVENEG